MNDDNRILSVGQSGYPEIMNRKAIDRTHGAKPYYDGDPFSKLHYIKNKLVSL